MKGFLLCGAGVEGSPALLSKFAAIRSSSVFLSLRVSLYSGATGVTIMKEKLLSFTYWEAPAPADVKEEKFGNPKSSKRPRIVHKGDFGFTPTPSDQSEEE